MIILSKIFFLWIINANFKGLLLILLFKKNKVFLLAACTLFKSYNNIKYHKSSLINPCYFKLLGPWSQSCLLHFPSVFCFLVQKRGFYCDDPYNVIKCSTTLLLRSCKWICPTLFNNRVCTLPPKRGLSETQSQFSSRKLITLKNEDNVKLWKTKLK